MSSRILKITSFVLFLLVNKKLRGVEHGEHESKQLFLLYFVAIVQGFKHEEFPAAELCLSVLHKNLSLIEEPRIHMGSYQLLASFDAS